MTNLHGMVGAAGLAQYISMDTARQIGIGELGVFKNTPGEPDDALNARLDGITSSIENNDVVILQIPTWNELRYEHRLIDRIKGRVPSAKIVIFVHDIEPFVFGNWSRLGEWLPLFNRADVLIVPNKFMKKYLVANGCTCQKFVYHYIWDNKSNLSLLKKPINKVNRIVQFPGNPDKFTFAKEWPSKDIPLHYYANTRVANPNLVQEHPLSNEELVLRLHEQGGFGILWEPEGRYLYMTMNTSMKFGAYMSAGLPVLIQQGVAQQELVERYHLGKVVRSLNDAVNAVKSISDAEYQEMAKNVNQVGKLTRTGYFTKQALLNAIYQALK